MSAAKECAECGRPVKQVCHHCWDSTTAKAVKLGATPANVGALEVADHLRRVLGKYMERFEAVASGSVIDVEDAEERRLWISMAEDLLYGSGLEIKRRTK